LLINIIIKENNMDLYTEFVKETGLEYLNMDSYTNDYVEWLEANLEEARELLSDKDETAKKEIMERPAGWGEKVTQV
jgi:hypothetical protein